jgi:hypothetical protein
MRTEILSLQVKAIFLFMEGKPDGASNILLLTSQLLTLSTHARSMLNLNIALTPVRICHCDTTRLSQSKFWLRDVKFLIKLLIWVGANMLYCCYLPTRDAVIKNAGHIHHHPIPGPNTT